MAVSKISVKKPSNAGVDYVAPTTPMPTYNAPSNNVKYTAPVQTAQYVAPQEYNSAYQTQIDSSLNKVANRQAFEYNPLEDASYQALARIYNKRGEQAAKNTLGDAAMLNGGFGSSYAVTAAQQARNDYNQEFAALIPQLEQNAYDRYVNNFNMDLSALGALQDADNAAYGRYRDDIGDRQWQFGVDYQRDRDAVSDAQAAYERNYNAYRDNVADAQWQYGQEYSNYRDDVADAQWKANFDAQQMADRWNNYIQSKNFNLDVQEANRNYTMAKKNYELAKKGSSSGGSRSSGGGITVGGGNDDKTKEYQKLAKNAKPIKKVGNTYVPISQKQVDAGMVTGTELGVKYDGKWVTLSELKELLS